MPANVLRFNRNAKKFGFEKGAWHSVAMGQRTMLALLTIAITCGWGGSVAAQDDLPPPPSTLPPRLAIEIAFDAVVPLALPQICDDVGDCVLSGGFGLGAGVDFRYPRGLSLGVAYDVALLGANGVFEFTSLQSLRFVARNFFLRHRQMHPFLGGGVALLALGAGFKPEAIGGAVDLMIGMEIELSTSLGVSLGTRMRAFSTSSFRPSADGIARAGEFGGNLLLLLEASIVLYRDP